GNLCADPKLAAPAAAEPDVRLLAGSPAIDAGDDALVPAALTTDVFGAPRIADGDGNGVARVDLGAVERPGPVPPVPPVPPAPPAPAPPAAAKDTTAPAISGLRLTSRTLRPAGKPGPRRPKAPPRTTTFRFRLSEAATVRIAFAPVVRRKARRAVGTLVRPGVKAGDVRVAFSGRLGRRVLRPGTYRATLTATDAAGNRSRPVIVTLTVVR
ncbi:MAG: hypothetical protein MUC84_09955, partial [Solirubrobacteraceae bacterium]|nr:hypothetical protein [Solirubrobacteraceae bacterium]